MGPCDVHAYGLEFALPLPTVPHMKRSIAFSGLILVLLAGCQVMQKITPQPDPLPTVEGLDLQRFMGTWYVIAATPTIIDRNAYNATEIYSLTDEGAVNIQYTYNKGSFSGERKSYQFKGSVDNPGVNSDWTISLGWPIKADYKIIHLEPDYSLTIVGHPNRRYAWVMSRQPTIPDTQYSDMMLKLQEFGYDIGNLRRVPQSVRR